VPGTQGQPQAQADTKGQAQADAKGQAQVDTVIGAFDTREEAGVAVDELMANGFQSDQISVLGKHGEVATLTPEHTTANHVAWGVGIGAAGGLALGGIVALAVPGVGPLLALGAWSPIFLGSVLGGMVGFLTAQGVPKEEAEQYADRVRAGAYLVAVHPSAGREFEAEMLLKDAGAEGPITHTNKPTSVP
jgi:hypothetical protein